MKTKILYGLSGILLIIIAIGVSGFLINSKPEPKKDNNSHNTIYVKASKVNLVEIEANMTYRGRVTAFDNISLGAEVSGKIMQGDVRFKAGERFLKGQTIINIYSQDVQAALKSGKSGLLQTISKILPDLKVDYTSEYKKWNDFFHIIDPEKPLPNLPKISSDKEKVFLASNNVLSNYYNIQQQEINLQRYSIYAPFNGSFKTVNKEIGAIASPGAELASIIRSDKLEVVVPVFPEDLKWIKKGDQVKITNNSGVEEVATVSRISNFIVDQSVNIYLTYSANKNQQFLEGGYVDVIFAGSKANGFEIPREAIVDKHFVYELKDAQIKKTPIKVVRQLNDMVIISGIDNSKTIVTESLATIHPGMDYMAR